MMLGLGGECPPEHDPVMTSRLGFCADLEGGPLAELPGIDRAAVEPRATPKYCSGGKLADPKDWVPCLPNNVLLVSGAAVLAFMVMGMAGGRR
jgi:hypothetical protein